MTDPEKWIASKQLIKFGGVGAGSGTDDLPNVLKATVALPIQMVSGYKGTADIRLAFNSGEISGISNSWESTKSTWKKELETGDTRSDPSGHQHTAPGTPEIAVGCQHREIRRCKEAD